jgi:hypothetical protein
MGASVSVVEYDTLNDEEKHEYMIKYEALIAEGKSEEDAIVALTIQRSPQLSVKEIELTALLDECELAVSEGKTPLVIDNSDDNKVDTFFGYRSFPVIDGKKMGLDKSMRKIPVPEIMEEARKKLVLAIKIGMPCCIAMTKSCTDFAMTFNDTKARELYGLPSDLSFLPIELFDNGGKKLLSNEFLEALIRKGDERKDTGDLAISRNPSGFHVILTSQFSPEDYEDYFFSNDWGLPKPKDKYQVLIIKPSPDA